MNSVLRRFGANISQKRSNENGEIQLKVFCMSKELGQYLTIFEECKQSQTHWVFSLYHGYFL